MFTQSYWTFSLALLKALAPPFLSPPHIFHIALLLRSQSRAPLHLRLSHSASYNQSCSSEMRRSSGPAWGRRTATGRTCGKIWPREIGWGDGSWEEALESLPKLPPILFCSRDTEEPYLGRCNLWPSCGIIRMLCGSWLGRVSAMWGRTTLHVRTAWAGGWGPSFGEHSLARPGQVADSSSWPVAEAWKHLVVFEPSKGMAAWRQWQKLTARA